ncbi:MAG TPA: stage II sporulation protein M [Bacillota bacterium]|nr:stage II sporulation protein M [Bacillota bacterium]
MGILKKGAKIVGANAKFLVLGLAIFVASILIGYLNADSIQKVAEELLRQLDHIARKIEEHGSPLYTFWVIFQNNVLAALSMIGLGVFLGIYPILALTSNGILLGFMLKAFALKGLNPAMVLLLGILPHGIVEISAIIFAASIGIKYGVLIFRIFSHLLNARGRQAVMDEFKQGLTELPFIVGSVIVLLFIAAVIESTITPYLIHLFLGDQIPLT